MPEIESEEIDIKDKAELPWDINGALLGKIAWQINNAGLNIRESCIVVGFSPDRFEKAMDDFPFIKDVIDRKVIEYKKKLLQPLVEKAKQGDSKLSQWLLEKRFSEEFGTNQKINKSELEDSNIFAIAIKEIQKNDNGLINKESGKAFMISKSKNKNIKEIIRDVKDMLV